MNGVRGIRSRILRRPSSHRGSIRGGLMGAPAPEGRKEKTLEQTTIEAAAPAATSLMVERAPFAKAAAFLASRIVERRNTIPILSNVLLEPGADGGLVMTGTDLDMVARVTIVDALFDVPGAFTLDAATLADITRKADGNTFDVKAEDGRACLTIGRARNRVATLPRDDFPVIGEPVAAPGSAVFELPAATLAAALDRIAFAMSNEETRYYLRGAAMQIRTVAGRPSLCFVATDGARMARVALDIPAGAESLADTIIPRKLVTVLQRAMKAFPGEDASFLVSPDGLRLAVVIGPLYIVAKAVDGTYPNWQLVDPVPGGELELQRLAFVDLEPDVRPGDVEAFSKALGAMPDVDIGEGIILFTRPDQPEYAGVAVRCSNEKSGKGSYETPASREAAAYLEGLARADGIDVDSLFVTPSHGGHEHGGASPPLPPYLPTQLHISRGLVRGVTFGKQTRYAGDVTEQVPCYETFTMKLVTRHVPDEWAEGAFSVVMPRECRGMAAAVTFGEPGEETALRTLSSGAIELSAAAVRRLAGDVADLPRVTLPRFTMLHGEIIAIDGVATDGTGRLCQLAEGPRIMAGRKSRAIPDRDAIAAYCADPAGTLAQLQPRYYEPAAEMPVAAVEPESDASDLCNGPLFDGMAWPDALDAALADDGVRLESLDGIVSLVATSRPKRRTRVPVRHQDRARELFEEQARRIVALPPVLPDVPGDDDQPREFPGDDYIPDDEGPALPAEEEAAASDLAQAVAALTARVAALESAAVNSPAPAASPREAELEAEIAQLREELSAERAMRVRAEGKRAATVSRLRSAADTVRLERRRTADAIAAAMRAEERAGRYSRHLSAARSEIARLRPLAGVERPPMIAPGVRLVAVP